MTATDAYDLDRFVQAQDSGRTYDSAVAELRAGRKTGHWMWFIFPQMAGLGFSPASRHFGIRSLAEARAYLKHPVLGPRLVECARLLSGQQGRTAGQIFGEIDATKLRSSMTLFRHADPAEPAYDQVLAQYFGGQADALTDQAVAQAAGGNFLPG